MLLNCRVEWGFPKAISCGSSAVAQVDGCGAGFVLLHQFAL